MKPQSILLIFVLLLFSDDDPSNTIEFLASRSSNPPHYYRHCLCKTDDTMEELSTAHRELFEKSRLSRERVHRWQIDLIFVRRPLKIVPRQPLPFITYDHLQDLCNKSVAIYRTTPIPFHTQQDIKDFIYEKWTKGNLHKVDIEFSSFFGKLIDVRDPREPGPDLFHDILETHNALLHRHRITEPLFQDVEETMQPENEGGLGFTSKQWQYHKIRALFRSLIMVIDTSLSTSPATQSVHLIRTGQESLGAPLSFGRLGNGDDKAVETTLEKAMDFALELEQLEADAFPEERERSELDSRLGGPGCIRMGGYSGEIRGPSSLWIMD